MRNHGFSLVEVLVALGILSGAALGGIHLLVIALRANADARTQTFTATLAAARLEQLRGLTFSYDDQGRRVTDVGVDLSGDRPGPGGSGLSSAGTDSIAASVPGFADYLGAQGQWLGNGPAPPRDAVFVRRWSIDPSAPATDLVVIQVLVRPVAFAGAAAAGRTRGEARLTTTIARVAR